MSAYGNGREICRMISETVCIDRRCLFRGSFVLSVVWRDRPV